MPKLKKYIAIEGNTTSRDEAIKLCGDALYQAGFVEKDFYIDCINRENEYPTGLDTKSPVAIPHCQSDLINTSGVCYLRLDQPVKFHRLDDDTQSIVTRHIFNLAIKNGDDHLAMLSAMMECFSKAEFILRLEKEEIKNVPTLLELYFDAGGNDK